MEPQPNFRSAVGGVRRRYSDPGPQDNSTPYRFSEVDSAPQTTPSLSESVASGHPSSTRQYDSRSPTRLTVEEAIKKLQELLKQKRRLDKPTKKMPQLFFVDGTFAELAQAMADIVQVGDQVKPMLEKDQKEDALAAIVKASIHLNSIAEKDYNPSYNLLIYLVLEFAQDPKKYLPTMCGNILKPITSSPQHHFALASNALTTIFNTLDEKNPLRYNVFVQMVRLVKANNAYDLLKPSLMNLKDWLKSWDTDEEAQRNLFVELAEVASEGGDDE